MAVWLSNLLERQTMLRPLDLARYRASSASLMSVSTLLRQSGLMLATPMLTVTWMGLPGSRSAFWQCACEAVQPATRPCLRGLGEQHHEFFAAVAGREVGNAEGIRQNHTDAAQNRVSGLVAVVVVDTFEVVQVEHQQGKIVAMALVAFDLFGQPLVETGAVVDFGQAVVFGLGFGLCVEQGVLRARARWFMAARMVWT